MSRDSSAGFFSGLIIGAIIGAAVSLLYAPQSGTETRRLVKEKAVAAKEKAEKAIERVKDEITRKSGREES